MFKRSLIILVLCSVVLIASEAKAQSISECREKLVCDQSGILSEQKVASITDYHKALLERFDIELRVVVMSHVGDMSTKAVGLFKEFFVGERSKTRKGVLLLIDPGQDKVRMEISAGLDVVYTDGFVTYLQQRQMVPFFTASRVADGILATTELIVDRAQKAALKLEFVNPEVLPKNLAIGAGAQGAAAIGKGYQPPASGNDISGSGMSPTQVVAAYHQALAQGNASPTLSIYSRATQQLKKSWVVTPAQMKMELNTYKGCQIDKVVPIGTVGAMTIVRYGIQQRQCAPYFLVREDSQWKLDFSTMMQVVRFNVENHWHFDMSKTPQSVLAAFSDCRFDKNGYAYRQ